ncbi:TlpA family protein disulfide reductase [Conexibacter arvalis]|uniref:Thiol-disulfide isomerase/thioredoxin n=1 Tax=Conexibacter arvalis TaxID=912552 RepID=A0A840IJV4_9ACTN|nr:TlpA disulfide reductase family protein [Conexibacter arvalis]MBB4664521.1 thiol-disulfide isomerase/thioredoxin [Conexibacter arvalis]
MTISSPRLACAAVSAATALTLAACGETPSPSPSTASPAELAAARAAASEHAGRLVDGGEDELKRRLKTLRGLPVVVNQWASWCPPCRYEFPFLRRLAKHLEGRVAFLGVNARDGVGAAASFLRSQPTPFAHVYDRDADAARAIGGGRSWPTTAFYDATGRRIFVMQGAYPTQEKLLEAIEQHAVGRPLDRSPR